MGGAVAYCIYNNMPDVFSGVNFMSPMCKISDDMLPAQWIVDMARKVAGPTGEATKIGFLPISPARGDLKQYSFKLAYRRALYTRAPTAFGRNPRMATARELIVSVKMACVLTCVYRCVCF
jgi:acylglycerol lipase